MLVALEEHASSPQAPPTQVVVVVVVGPSRPARLVKQIIMVVVGMVGLELPGLMVLLMPLAAPATLAAAPAPIIQVMAAPVADSVHLLALTEVVV
jgi:hypothetical protein